MPVHPERVRKLNAQPEGDGPVVYWMSRDGRVTDNWAYLYAKERAEAHKVPLLVVYNLHPGFLGGGYRQHVFKVEGLREVEKRCADLKTPFFLVSGENTAADVCRFAEEHSAGTVVTDFFPLRLPRAWIEEVRSTLSCAFYGVDAHNIVPCWFTSDKQEFAARTIRPKLHRLVPEYLEPFPEDAPHTYPFTGTVPQIDWDAIREDERVDRSVAPVSWATPGYATGMKELRRFIDEKLPNYADKRNDPNADAQSNLSPYFHYGHIAPQRVALEVVRAYGESMRKPDANPQKLIQGLLHKEKNGSKKGSSYEAFLEELIVRRELSDNFCFYNPHYDSVEGFPDWAKATLDAHRNDAREHLYTREVLETGKTHDDLWNAAQHELTERGKLSGYMRMYWAKKLLEWTESPERAMEESIYLNDKYELDGRDPNGYTGIAWSIGGVHDRPWFNREIFGTIRYMARSGAEKKFDVEAYISRWGG